MAVRLDHIVIGVNDLATASADYSRAGFQVTPGGEHSSGNTHNALVTFADGAYLELIAFKGGKITTDHKWGQRLAGGEGYLDFALAASDLEAEATRLTQAGITTGGVRPLGRLRPDGQRIDWLLLNPEPGAVPLPFLIDDITPRELRVPGGAAAEHPLGVTGVGIVTLLVQDLPAASGLYETYLGLPADDVASTIPGVAAARRFTFGAQAIELAQPDPDAQDLLTYLTERGSAPYEISLLTPSGEGATGKLLPLAETHQARIRIERAP